MSDLLSIDTYRVLIESLTGEWQTSTDIAKHALPRINALGPFDRSEFEVSDVICMLGQLHSNDLIERVSVSKPIYNGMAIDCFSYRKIN